MGGVDNSYMTARGKGTLISMDSRRWYGIGLLHALRDLYVFMELAASLYAKNTGGKISYHMALSHIYKLY